MEDYIGKKKSGCPKALSLYPIMVQDAVSVFIAVDPKKIEKRLEREKVKNYPEVRLSGLDLRVDRITIPLQSSFGMKFQQEQNEVASEFIVSSPFIMGLLLPGAHNGLLCSVWSLRAKRVILIQRNGLRDCFVATLLAMTMKPI